MNVGGDLSRLILIINKPCSGCVMVGTHSTELWQGGEKAGLPVRMCVCEDMGHGCQGRVKPNGQAETGHVR